MEGRFIVKDNTALNNKHLLLVDDVITTGATLEACGQELLRAGVESLSVFTLAYTGRI
jgi:predicted amidophosphoribosyltransferase